MSRTAVNPHRKFSGPQADNRIASTIYHTNVDHEASHVDALFEAGLLRRQAGDGEQQCQHERLHFNHGTLSSACEPYTSRIVKLPEHYQDGGPSVELTKVR